MGRIERLREELKQVDKTSKIKSVRERPKRTSLEIENERFVGLRERVSDLLHEINLKALEGKGEIVEWQETSTPEHTHRFPRSWGHWKDEWSHFPRQMETRLMIPEVGELVVFAPLHGRQKFGFSASHLRILSVGSRDREGKGENLCNQKGTKISFGYSDDRIREKLSELLASECVRIHKSAPR